ncbi:transposase [Streptomyces sp. NPDC004285]
MQRQNVRTKGCGRTCTAAPGRGGGPGEGLGRSRGGFTTQVHLSADGRCRPLSLVITPGQRADRTRFTRVREKIRVPRCGPGRPRRKARRIAADKAYSTRCLAELRRSSDSAPRRQGFAPADGVASSHLASGRVTTGPVRRVRWTSHRVLGCFGRDLPRVRPLRPRP